MQQGAEEADKALKMAREERLSLVVDLQPSEDEDDDMDDLDRKLFIDVDPDLRTFLMKASI